MTYLTNGWERTARDKGVEDESRDKQSKVKKKGGGEGRRGKVAREAASSSFGGSWYVQGERVFMQLRRRKRSLCLNIRRKRMHGGICHGVTTNGCHDCFFSSIECI